MALSFLSFQSGLTSLCFVDDLCQILGMFSLIVYWLRNKVRSHKYLEGIKPTDVCMFNVLKSFIQKDLSNILTMLDEEQAHGATK